MTPGPIVIAVSSHVARGSVGNRGAVFALERLGFAVWAVPTVLLPHHPGHGPSERIVPDDGAFGRMLDALVKDEERFPVAGILSGYFASARQADAVAGLVARVKSARADALYLCDPIVGDSGRLYVSDEIAESVRDRLMPLADAATPNAFECAWLAGCGESADPDLPALARRLSTPTVLVTSAPALMRGQTGNLLIAGGETLLLEHPQIETSIKGTGDLLGALFLARRLQGRSWAEAAQLALSSVFEVLSGSARAGAEELMLPALQDALIQPRAAIGMRKMAVTGRSRDQAN
jgi:pyridoxine kinase